MDVPTIVARSLPEANMDLSGLRRSSAVVSIGEPGSDPPYGFKKNNPLHFRMEFHDVIDDLSDPRIRPPQPEDIERLLEHARILRTANYVYCHCNAGISRSTATAYILRCLWMGPGREAEAIEAVVEDREIADPNELMVRHADAQLERDGAMLDALRELRPPL